MAYHVETIFGQNGGIRLTSASD